MKARKILAVCGLMFALASGSLMAFSLEKPLRVADQKFVSRTVHKPGDIRKDAKYLTQAQRREASRTSGRSIDIASLKGGYVMSCTSIVANEPSGGKYCEIAPIEGTDSITITDFWDKGVVVKAKVDVASGQISIPSQKVGTDEKYGDYDIAVCLKDGVPDRNVPITGHVSDDGTIVIDGWWGVFFMSGTFQNLYLAAYNNTEAEKANATMSYSRKDGSEESFGVVFRQLSRNLVTVKNFGNYGQTVEISLSRDRAGSIEQQNIREYPRNGNFMTYGVTSWTDDGQPQGLSTDIYLQKSADSRTLKWGNWTAVSQGAKYLYFGALVAGEIKTSQDIQYPAELPSAFEGDGTSAKPFLVKTADDLLLLADKVNSGEKYSGKYFRMENDIDLANLRFTPIGNAESSEFDGVFDANGKTVSNFSVSTGKAGYAGLFGIAGTNSVIKNLSVDNAAIRSDNNYNGTIVAQSKGTVENCHVSNSALEAAGSVAGGLAGSVMTITDCSVTESRVTGNGGYAGGLAGEVNKSATDCHATGVAVKANASTALFPSGGLFGMLYEASAKNCYFAGSLDGRTGVSTSLSLGGIAGACTLGSIDGCFSTGTISAYGADARVGGVVGSLAGSELSNSYSSGFILSPSSVQSGGLAGYVKNHSTGKHSSVRNCYTATSLDVETYKYDPKTGCREIIGLVDNGSTVENVYFDRQLTNYRSEKYGVSTSVLTSAAGPSGFDAAIWSFRQGQYPMLKYAASTEAAKLSASAVVMPSGSSLAKLAADAELHPLGATRYSLYKEGALGNEGHCCSIADSKLKIKDEFGTDTLVVENGSVSYLYYVKVAPVPFDGDGSEVNPFLIKTKDDLIKLGEFTNVGKQYFADTHFRMTNDIDLQYSSDFKGICAVDADALCRFSGTFDGGGFTIHNMKLDGYSWSEEPKDGQLGTPNADSGILNLGFIGRLASDGVLKNLSIAADAKLSFWASSAPLVGYCFGHIDNCRNYADVLGESSWIGGIAGQVASSGRISNCYNAGDVVSGYMAVGGIAGISSGVIENSMNVGNVEAKTVSTFSNKLGCVGGIAGQSLGASYANVVNAGNISGAANVGGIAGTLPRESDSEPKYKNDIVGAVNYGMVAASDKMLLGAIGGEAGTRGQVRNVYYDSQILPIAANANTGGNSMKGVETSLLTGGEALPGLEDSLWSFEKGMYPVLRQFRDEPQATLLRKVVATIPTGYSAKDVHGRIMLSAVGGASWTLKDGRQFTIADGVVSAPDTVTTIVADTLVAAAGDYTKVIPLRSVYGVPLKGDGTEANPYAIASADDWNKAAEYISATGMTFEGKHLRIVNDFSFEGIGLKMLSSDGIAMFNGELDGGGKTISGVSLTATAEGQSVLGTIGDAASVSNLTIEGSVESAFDNTGGFSSGIYGMLTNCVNKVSVTGSKGDGVSGFGKVYSSARLVGVVNKATMTGNGDDIAGLASESGEGAEFSDCGNEGKIVNAGKGSNTAGLVAVANPGRFVRCYNTGEIAASTDASTMAGLVAYADAPAGNDGRYEFDSCYNTSAITAKTIAAGLIASSKESRSVYNPMTITGCYNTGDVTTVGSGGFGGSFATAGLIGIYSAGSEIADCYNKGKITSEKTTYAAGIAGNYTLKTTADSMRIFIRRCHNEGEIVANGNQGGGIVGATPDYITVDSCYNRGNVSGKFALGGIAANLSSKNAVLDNCWNAGDVTTSMNRAGGIVGWNNAAATVSRCFNLGNVTNTTKGYGIGGIAGNGGAVFADCYNMGTLTGENEVGGIVGEPFANTTQIIGCYNAGKIVALADTCGSLIGVNPQGSRYWKQDNKVENSFYVTDYGTYGHDKVGTGMTLAELAKKDMGKSWVGGDDYTLPVLASLQNVDYALLNAALLVLDGDDTPEKVTRGFFIGTPSGLSWSASPSVVTIDGNAVSFAENYKGQLVMTATVGELSKSVTLDCDAEVSTDGA